MGRLSKSVLAVVQFVAFAAALFIVTSIVVNLSDPPHARELSPKLVQGVLDAKRWNFLEQGTISLSGSWVYKQGLYADRLNTSNPSGVEAQVPGSWPMFERNGHGPKMNGVGLYTIKIFLPDIAMNDRMAIDTGYWLSAYRVYANGELLLESGTPSASAKTEVGNAYAKVVSLPKGVREIELTVEVSNHLNRYGGSFVAPTIGLESALRGHQEFIRTLSSVLIGAMIFAALYHLVLFVLDRRSPSNLWFALFAALLGVRTMTIEPLAAFAVNLIGQDWVWRIDFAASIMLLPAAFQFFQTSFPKQITPKLAPWIWGFFMGSAVFTLIAGVIVGETAMKVMEVIALAFIVYLTTSLVRAVLQREQGASLALSGWSLCAVASVHDILLDNGFLVGMNLIPYAFLAFFLCLSGMLAARFRDAFHRAQSVSRKLRTINEELETAVQLRTVELKDKLDELSRNQAALVRAREDAVAASVAKSKFLATMSHELRTPLNSILGFSEIIRDQKLGDLGDPRYISYAAYINESGAHLLDLISDILDLSRVESGKLVLRYDEVCVSEVVGAAISKAATRERRAADAVCVNVPRNLPLLSADRRALTQMIINLVSNAIKFTPPDGHITLTAFETDKGGLILQVADTGIGMAAEDIPRAMTAFTQVDDNLSRRHEGSGLGLTIVNSMMEQHGGRVIVTSEKGFGTTVQLEFPASRVVASRRIIHVDAAAH